MTPKHHWKISFWLVTKADGTGAKYVHGPQFFEGGMATIQAARMAASAEHAQDILQRHYKGVDGSLGNKWIEWEITAA